MRFKYILPILLAASLGELLCGCDQAPPDSLPPTDETVLHTHTAAMWQTTVAPTCTEEGAATGECIECGETLHIKLDKIPHTYTETVTPPACETEGFTRYTCDCGYTYDTNHTAPTGHTLIETVIPPACETEGYTRFTCDCGYTYDTNHTAPTGHTLTETVMPPTCEIEGFTRYTCDCGYTYDTNHVAPTGHTLTATVTPPTCETEGFTRYTCDCGYTYDTNHVTPTGHTLTATVIPPTCTEEGYTHYVCTICSHEHDANPTAPLVHANATTEIHHATVSRVGFTRHTCPDCGYTFDDNYVAYSEIFSGAYTDNTVALMQGIDTSKWNHEYGASLEDIKPLDWEALKAAGVEFVILKAGSTNGIDPAFEMDYLAAKAAGLQVGAYFYAHSTTVEDTLRDADMLLGWLEGKQFEYPIYFDAEDSTISGLGQELLTEMCLAFAEHLQEAGYYTALYTNTEWLYNLLDTDAVRGSLDIWYARYTADKADGSSAYTLEDTDFTWKDGTAYNPGEPDHRYGLWQYTCYGYIDGFRYHFDFNYAFKDYKSVMVEWGLNGF